MTLELCIARYLLMSQKEDRAVKTVDLIMHILTESYNLDDLLKAVESLEKSRFIRSKHGLMTITQAGIDHFFRVSERD